MIMDVIQRLFISGGIGIIISLIYFFTTEKHRVEREMIHSLIFLNMIICLAMMAIGNNLASAFGLVGAVSIIRFRTSVKSARDMAFVFFTVVAGMAMGLGFVIMAITGFVVIGIMIVVIYLFNHINRPRDILHCHIKVSYWGLLKHRFSIEEILGKIGLLSIKSDGNKVNLLYRLELNSSNEIDRIIESINALEELKDVKIQVLEIS